MEAVTLFSNDGCDANDLDNTTTTMKLFIFLLKIFFLNCIYMEEI